MLAIGGFAGAAPATAQTKTCVQVVIPGQKSDPFACLNQQLQSEALAASGQASPTAPITANSPANATGTFNETGVSQQYGKNFGVSATPYRPAVPTFNPTH